MVQISISVTLNKSDFTNYRLVEVEEPTEVKMLIGTYISMREIKEIIQQLYRPDNYVYLDNETKKYYEYQLVESGYQRLFGDDEQLDKEFHYERIMSG